MNNNTELWLLTTWSLQHMYIHITRCTHAQNKLRMQGTYTGVVKGRGGHVEHSDALTRSGKVSFSESSNTLVRCCSLHLEVQWHIGNSLLLSFHWTLCLCFLVLQVIDCGLLAPLTPFPRGSVFCSILPSSLPLYCWCWHALAALWWPRYESVRVLVPLQHWVILGVMDVKTYFTDTARLLSSYLGAQQLTLYDAINYWTKRGNVSPIEMFVTGIKSSDEHMFKGSRSIPNGTHQTINKIPKC